MDIKGVGNFKNDLKIKSSEDSVSSRKQSNISNASRAEKVEVKDAAVNSRIKGLMQEMKNVQNRVSEQQSYLESLHTAKRKLISNRSIIQIYQELMELRNKAQFNKKPLMDTIIPGQRDFYKTYDNIKEIKNRVSNEIERTRRNIRKSQQQLSGFSISIENIRASLNSKDIKEMQSVFNNSMLYKNFNKDLVISLMS